jgi:hypothetical protein
MFLRSKTRIKDGKPHCYWSIVENRRVSDKRVVQRQVLYLGEINDSQHSAWCRAIDVFDGVDGRIKQMALFPDEKRPSQLPPHCDAVQVHLSGLQLKHPRQWGACWLACELWNQLRLDEFWIEKLPRSRKGTNWLHVLKTLVSYRLIDPGSEWRLHRHWYVHSAMGDLLGDDFRVAEISTLYRCLDKVVAHKAALFTYLRDRWKTLFGACFDVLLYDLTSTYFEVDVPPVGKRTFGYSRDKRPDCVQVVIALIVTPDGFPIAYEVFSGNTSDKTTLRGFLERIETQYGKANRVWVMDRGIPTEEVLKEMRNSETPVSYLVGTPKGRLTKLEQRFLSLPWAQARFSVDVKLLKEEDEIYVLVRSEGRVTKERKMRQRRLRRLLSRLKELQGQSLSRDQLLLKVGAAKKEAGRAYGLVDIVLPKKDEDVTAQTFSFKLNRKKLRLTRRREGHYLLRTNLTSEAPKQLWTYYIQLTEIEQAFKELKHDLAIRPVYHQRDERIEAHIFVSFLAYCLQATLKHRVRALAPGITPLAVLEKFATMQMVDVHLPTTDGRMLLLSRYTEPEDDLKLLLQELDLHLPAQPPPKISASV